MARLNLKLMVSDLIFQKDLHNSIVAMMLIFGVSMINQELIFLKEWLILFGLQYLMLM